MNPEQADRLIVATERNARAIEELSAAILATPHTALTNGFDRALSDKLRKEAWQEAQDNVHRYLGDLEDRVPEEILDGIFAACLKEFSALAVAWDDEIQRERGTKRNSPSDTANQILAALEEAFLDPELEKRIRTRQQTIQGTEECQTQIQPDSENSAE